MKYNDVLLISMNFYADLNYEESFNIIKSYFSEKDRFHFQLLS